MTARRTRSSRSIRKTLQLKDWFTQPNAEFVTGPTIVSHHGKDIVAAATKDGRIILLDTASLGGADHSTPLHASKPLLAAGASVSGDALAAWEQSIASVTSAPAAATPQATAGTAWILMPASGRLSAGAPATNGAVSTGAVVALKLTDAGSAPAVEVGWVSHDVSSPATPIIVNGVVFIVATGTPSTAAGRGAPAVLHAYEGGTGKRLWSSNTTMTTFASPGSFWSAMGQVYVGTHDGTLYAFGFNDERRPTNGG